MFNASEASDDSQKFMANEDSSPIIILTTCLLEERDANYRVTDFGPWKGSMRKAIPKAVFSLVFALNIRERSRTK